jgi:hypothetical protein
LGSRCIGLDRDGLKSLGRLWGKLQPRIPRDGGKRVGGCDFRGPIFEAISQPHYWGFILGIDDSYLRCSARLGCPRAFHVRLFKWDSRYNASRHDKSFTKWKGFGPAPEQNEQDNCTRQADGQSHKHFRARDSLKEHSPKTLRAFNRSTSLGTASIRRWGDWHGDYSVRGARIS